MVDLYLSGQLMLDELVSLTRPLDRFGEVVEAMHAGQVARGVLTFD
jgi:Zn-dependent alcohol dehydrogenase